MNLKYYWREYKYEIIISILFVITCILFGMGIAIDILY